MIIVHLNGGLGNQMFQYAMGRHLAEIHSTILKLDLSGFETSQLRRYELHCFHIWEHMATQTEIDLLSTERYARLNTLARRVLNKLGSTQSTAFYSPNPYYFTEDTFSFD